MKRRELLKLPACCVLAMGLGAPGVGQTASQRRWGLQLFTVLPLLQKNFEDTIGAVAALGYAEVETIGALGRDPRDLRAILDRHGLKSPSQHIASDFLFDSFSRWSKREISSEENQANYVSALQPENIETLVASAITYAKILGQSYITWPILMAPHLASRKSIDAFAKGFNRAGSMCRDEGITFAYHNHAREFGKIDGEVIYDLLLAQTDSGLVKLELDLYWINLAKADAFAYLAANAGRFKMAHVKDMTATGDFAVVGGGVLDLPRLIAAARRAGVEHFFVEYDRSADPMREIASSIKYLATF